MRTVHLLAILGAAPFLGACNDATPEDPGPPGGYFTVTDETGSQDYVAAEGGLTCIADKALDGTPLLRVDFKALEGHPTASLNLTAGPRSSEPSIYDGERWGASEPETTCGGGPCWGVWWHPSSEKTHLSTAGTHECILETTPHGQGVAGDFDCAQLEPAGLAITNGHFYCTAVTP